MKYHFPARPLVSAYEIISLVDFVDIVVGRLNYRGQSNVPSQVSIWKRWTKYTLSDHNLDDYQS